MESNVESNAVNLLMLMLLYVLGITDIVARDELEHADPLCYYLCPLNMSQVEKMMRRECLCECECCVNVCYLVTS